MKNRLSKSSFEESPATSIQKQSSKKKTSVNSRKAKSKKSISSQILAPFLTVKVVILILAHISFFSVKSNNYAGNLILFDNTDLNIVDGFIKYLVRPLINWDAVHMMAIARHGYIFENQFAFFPLLPIGSRLLALGLLKYCGIRPFISLEALVSLIAIIIVNLCHYCAALVLYKLTLHLFKSSKFARTSVMLFIFNPASVQLSSFYTEAPFAFLTFAGMYQFYQNNWFYASIIWAMASTTRSNGIVLIGFFFYDLLTSIFRYYVERKNFMFLVKKSFLTILYSLIAVSGFIGHLAYGYDQYCNIPNPTRPWCNSRIPNLYSFVQKEYWNVGLFNYFQIKQIPNFLLASPMILISCTAIFLYFDADHVRFLSLGFSRSFKQKSRKFKCFLSDSVLPHIYLLIFMLMYNVFVAHVQIITRLFTFMPVVYWIMAHLIINYGSTVKETLLTYMGLYGTIGVALFALHYPPA
jgi:GPI mannosyltransferase 2